MDKEQKDCAVRRWRRRKEARPSEILEAALKLFVERGYNATRLEQIADAAGISKGTLYLYYSSKEDLFRSMVREVLLPHVERFEKQALDHQGSARDLLRAMAFGWWQSVGGTELAGIPKLMIAEANNFPELARYYVEQIIERARKLVGNIVQRGIDQNEFRKCNTDLAARTLLAPLVFAAIWKNSLQQFDRPYSIEEYIELHLDLTLNGLINQ